MGLPIENPYSPPLTQSGVAKPALELNQRDVNILGRSLIAFGLCGFVGPVFLAIVTDNLFLDLIAMCIGLTGVSVTRRSFSRFPKTILLLFIYPLIMTAGFFQEDLWSIQYWFIPVRNGGAPLIFCVILGLWALPNIWMIYRQNLINRSERLMLRALQTGSSIPSVVRTI